MPNLVTLPARDADGGLNGVVEVPRGARAKIKYEPDLDTFRFDRPLVLGAEYPYDWGFIPSTIAEDGDPLDAMVYHDIPTHPGVVIPSKAIGVVRLTQKIKGEKRKRNDRIIVVPAQEKRWSDATTLERRVHPKYATSELKDGSHRQDCRLPQAGFKVHEIFKLPIANCRYGISGGN